MVKTNKHSSTQGCTVYVYDILTSLLDGFEILLRQKKEHLSTSLVISCMIRTVTSHVVQCRFSLELAKLDFIHSNTKKTKLRLRDLPGWVKLLYLTYHRARAARAPMQELGSSPTCIRAQSYLDKGPTITRQG